MFPARAGMNREYIIYTMESAHVPRTCGDEPESGMPSRECAECSPHVRG